MQLVLITFLVAWAPALKAYDNKKLQLQLSDTVSIFSEKAYRRDEGQVFEAIGNVVISSGKDTLYGEKASIDLKRGHAEIEGSVRYVGQNVTIYGSKISYHMQSQSIKMLNARMITPDFSIVASLIDKKSDTEYYAEQAEFTTCKDCTESWQIAGKKVFVEIGNYVTIHHALAKVKGIDVIYLPYIALPIKTERQSGLLFPQVSSRTDEGLIYEQPIYWALDRSQDMTFTPTFLSQRGYGLNYEYRKYFGEKKWLEFSDKLINDKIYEPYKMNQDTSGTNYFRHLFELEQHHQFSHNFSYHLNVVGTKDLDFVRDYSYYADDYVNSSDLGLDFNLDKRFEHFNFSVETRYKQNMLTSEILDFDSSYVQVLPSLNFSMMPYILWENNSNYFYKLSTGFDSEFSVFKQNRIDESIYLRNASRLDANPYLDLNILSLGPVLMKSRYQVYSQRYKFLNDDEEDFNKQAGLVRTELSFAVDRIFGLAYQEVYDASEIKNEDLVKLTEQTNPKKENTLKKDIVGVLPRMEDTVTKESITVKKDSYRHSQEFKFIHHQLVHSNESGNERYKDQISTEDGWFDYKDAIRENIVELESNEARKEIPTKNTFELQWNNVLIKKSSKTINYWQDHKFLKDNFTYKKLGHFNISQGIQLDKEYEDFNESLTRLYIDSSYRASSWRISFKDYYSHQSSDHIMSFSGQKKFEIVNLLTQYNNNSYEDSNLESVKFGIQYRPIDVLGFSFLKEYDIDAEEDISTIYQTDFMPHNNCWILNFSYKESFLEKRYNFTVVFNFGNESFKEFREDFFSFDRLN